MRIGIYDEKKFEIVDNGLFFYPLSDKSSFGFNFFWRGENLAFRYQIRYSKGSHKWVIGFMHWDKRPRKIREEENAALYN